MDISDEDRIELAIRHGTLHAKFRDYYVFSCLLSNGMYLNCEQNLMCFYCLLMGAC